MTDKNTNKKITFPRVVTGLYVFAVLCVLPLIYHNYYFDILETKYFFYCGCAISMLVLFVGYWFFTLQWSKVKNKQLSVPDMAMIAFITVSTLSTLFSKYRYESFWGNEGRFTGLFLLLLYTSSYFIVTRYLKVGQWMLDLFLLSGSLMGLFGITDYFQMNLLGFKDQISRTQMNIFSSTIGNINTYTAMLALVLAVAVVLYATSKDWKHIVGYYIAMVIAFFAIIMGNSDNAYLALAALFVLLPLYLFREQTGVRKYVTIIATFMTVSQVIDWINSNYADKIVGLDSMFHVVVAFKYLLQVVIMLWVIVAAMLVWEKQKLHKAASTPEVATNEKKRKPQLNALQTLWLVLIAFVILAVLYLLYDANIAGHAERYEKLSSYFVFNDEWGTHRGFIWRIGMENYAKFPILQKIFGHGPDTFGIITVLDSVNKAEAVRRYGEIFDSAHNEYLQYFITIGPLGLLAYLTLLISACTRMLKKSWKNPCVVATVAAIICYGAQAVVNINLPIATPVMWTLMMVGLAWCREE